MHLPDLKIAAKRDKSDNKYIELNSKYEEIFKGKKYFLRTYGCQMNVHDSEAITNYLEQLGFIKTEDINDANVVVLNTCAIRENAKDKVVGFLGKCKYLKKGNPDFTVVLTGCMTQQPDFVEEVMTKNKYVDILIGTHNIHELPELLLKHSGKQTIEVYSKIDAEYSSMKRVRKDNFRIVNKPKELAWP